MRVGAGRWILRQRSRPYGAQQARNLRNVLTHDEGTPSTLVQQGFLRSVKSSENKGWVRLVPASAVKPAALVVLAFIGLKAYVVGSASSL
jgi:hypothetical protein